MRAIFLHGFLGNKRDWDRVIELLPFECIPFDLPGHGSSPINFDLFGAMKTLEPFHLIGYSMGGRLALQYPGNPLSLILLSTHTGLKNGRAKRLEKDRQIAKEIRQLPIDAFLKKWYDQPLFKSLRDKLDICSMRKEQNREALAEAVVKYSLAHQEDFSDRKCLKLVGEHDEKFRALNQGAIVVPNAGHAVHLENPEFVGRKIYEHVLSTLETGRDLHRH